jgi:hypothetical protein
MWNTRKVSFIVRVNMWGLCGEKIIIFLFASDLYFEYKQCLQKVLKKNKKEMHDKMEVMMKVLMSKIDDNYFFIC